MNLDLEYDLTQQSRTITNIIDLNAILENSYS